jgi:hypothetical protein
MSAYPGDEIIARTISEKNDDPLFLFVSIGHPQNIENYVLTELAHNDRLI